MKTNRRRLFKAAGIGLLGLSGCINNTENKVNKVKSYTQNPNSWPMIRFDPQNSGHNPTTGPKDKPELRKSTKVPKTSSLTSNTPITLKGEVYISSKKLSCRSIDGKKVETKWEFKTQSDNATIEGLSTPVLGNGMVYITNTIDKLYALDIETGGKKWVVKSGDITSPRIAGETLYTSSSAGTQLKAIDAINGKEKWSYGIETRCFGVNGDSGKVYVSTTRDRENGITCLNKGREEWFKSTSKKVFSTPVVDKRNVYALNEDGMLYSLDVDTGSTTWETKVTDVKRGTQLSMCMSHGNLYLVTNKKGDPYTFAVKKETGNISWKKKTGICFGPPVSDNTGIYVPAVNEGIYKLDPETGEIKWNLKDIKIGRGKITVVKDKLLLNRPQVLHVLE